MEKISKSVFVSSVAAQCGLTKNQAGAIVDVVFGEIRKQNTLGNSVRIPGFGTFDIAHRAERKARNPITGESVFVPAKKLPVFKAATAFKNALNEEK